VFASRIEQGARTVPMMMAALSAYHAGPWQVVARGDAMMDVLRKRYLPFAVTVPLADLDTSRRSDLARLLPWIEPMVARADAAIAYLCRNFVCEAPITSPTELEAKL